MNVEINLVREIIKLKTGKYSRCIKTNAFVFCSLMGWVIFKI